MGLLKSYLTKLFLQASLHNRKNILDLVSRQKPQVFLDLGCDDGDWTMQVAQSAEATKVTGIEVVLSRAQLARSKNIEVYSADLGKKFPVLDASVDLVHANQVIEHVADIDFLVSEIMRVLKPGGHFVVSTENGSSWHNIFAAILGWQIFSLTNMSKLKAGIGNPMALLREQQIEFGTWTHKVIFNYRGLQEFFTAHGFTDLQIKGAGYYPFPTSVANLDPRHSHFLTIAGRKPKIN